MRGLAFLFVSFGIFGRNAVTVDFDSLKAGVTPDEWTFAMTHKGVPPRWIVRSDTTAPSHPNVLAQVSADRNTSRYALALFDRGYTRNGDVSAIMKIVSGKPDQTGGLIWRYQDPGNFYVLQVSANEDTIAVLRMVEGRVSPVAKLGPGLKAFQVSHKIDPQQWNVLRVSYRDNHVTVYFDHRKVMEADDVAIQKPGKTGLWTKGDTVAYFDDFRIEKKKE